MLSDSREKFEKRWKCNSGIDCSTRKFSTTCRNCGYYKTDYINYLKTHTYPRDVVEDLIDRLKFTNQDGCIYIDVAFLRSKLKSLDKERRDG